MSKVFAQYANVGDVLLEIRYGKNGWEWSVRNRRKDSQALGKANSLEHAKACAEEVAGGKPKQWRPTGRAVIEKSDLVFF
jgi:hypothetical protein